MTDAQNSPTDDGDGGLQRTWDGKKCPYDDCDGELQHQDDLNVMCLDCEGLFVAIGGDEPHLVDGKNQTVAKIKAKTIRNTEPDTLEDLRAVSEGQEVYIEYREVDDWGIPAIDGEVVEKHEKSSEDHAATITLLDNSRGYFDLILEVGDNGLYLDGGIEAQSNGRGYHVIEMQAVETLEIEEASGDV